MKQKAERQKSYGKTTIILALIATLSILSFEVMPDDLFMASWYQADQGTRIQRVGDGDDRLNSKVMVPIVIAHAVSMSSRTKELTVEKDKTTNSVVSLRLSPAEWKKVSGLLKEWNMTIEEFCDYSVRQIADAHKSKRKKVSSNIVKKVT